MISVLFAGDPQRENMDAIQKEIATLTAERKATSRADLPASELRSRFERAVRTLMESPAGKSVHGRLRYLRQPEGRSTRLLENNDRSGAVAAWIVSLLGEDVIAERLFELASTREDYSPGLPAGERAARIAELDRELRELAVAEETEARRIESQGGVFVMRRPIAKLDLDAVLEAWDQVA